MHIIHHTRCEKRQYMEGMKDEMNKRELIFSVFCGGSKIPLLLLFLLLPTIIQLLDKHRLSTFIKITKNLSV